MKPAPVNYLNCLRDLEYKHHKYIILNINALRSTRLVIRRAFMIFPPVNPLPETLRQPQTRQEVLQQIQSDPEALMQYNLLTTQDQEALIDFCMGNRGLKITYDPFFQNIFHPIKHPERLSSLLSAILKQPVTVKEILPREGVRLAAEASLMIMDIIVELADGSLVNVEMQKIGYEFPIERAFCYGADLLVRQYDRIRYNLQKQFKYSAMQPVYIIVLMETSTELFKLCPNRYIHRSTFRLDSGLSIENLLNFIYIPLDIFRKMPHNELNELEAWLYFLSSDNPVHIQQIIDKYPFFKDIYHDIINFRYHPKELITMFSESLHIADQNTITFMIDELKEQVQELDSTISAKNAEIIEKNNIITGKNAELLRKTRKSPALKHLCNEKNNKIAREQSRRFTPTLFSLLYTTLFLHPTRQPWI